MSSLGKKAGERIRTTDVQLGKGQARLGNNCFDKWLRRLPRVGDQLGAGRLAGRVSYCHLLTIRIRSPFPRGQARRDFREARVEKVISCLQSEQDFDTIVLLKGGKEPPGVSNEMC